MSHLADLAVETPVFRTEVAGPVVSAPPIRELPRPHYLALDGLRGLAVAAVFVGHLAFWGAAVPVGQVDGAVDAVLRSGWIGVNIFFVLSGFLITGILLDERGEPMALRRFYWRRSLRIVPAYGVALLAQAAVLTIRGRAGQVRLAWTATWLTNILLTREGAGKLAPGMFHYWSLAVEEQFYMLWPFAVLFLPRRVMPWFCGALIATGPLTRSLLFAFGNHLGSYVLLPSEVDCLAWGALLACLVRTPMGLAGLARMARGPALVAATVIGALFLFVMHPLVFKDMRMLAFGITALSIVSGGLLVTAAAQGGQGLVGRFFEQGWLRWLGKFSYGIYLWHYPVLLVLHQAGINRAIAAAVGQNYLITTSLYGALAFALTILFTQISWRLVEAPLLRYKDRMPAWLGRPAVAAG